MKDSTRLSTVYGPPSDAFLRIKGALILLPLQCLCDILQTYVSELTDKRWCETWHGLSHATC